MFSLIGDELGNDLTLLKNDVAEEEAKSVLPVATPRNTQVAESLANLQLFNIFSPLVFCFAMNRTTGVGIALVLLEKEWTFLGASR